MYKYIIFSELCPTEHNPRTQNATLLGLGTGTWGVIKRDELGRSLRRWDLAFGKSNARKLRLCRSTHLGLAAKIY